MHSKTKLSLFVDDMIVYIENLSKTTRICEFGNVSINKNELYFCIPAMNKWKINVRKKTINTNIQKHEILKNKLNKRWTNKQIIDHCQEDLKKTEISGEV